MYIDSMYRVMYNANSCIAFTFRIVFLAQLVCVS